MFKVPNFIVRFLGEKFLEFCEATKSNTFALYYKILSTFVKCLCVWNCMTLHSFFPHPSLYLSARKQLFLCQQRWFGGTTPSELHGCFTIVFHYQLETNKKPRPQSKFLEKPWYRMIWWGNFYLILFVNCKTIEIDLYNAVNFP